LGCFLGSGLNSSRNEFGAQALDSSFAMKKHVSTDSALFFVLVNLYQTFLSIEKVGSG
jgi:hypothetical protein